MISGIGTMLVTPIIGDLSDEYGRKPLLMVSMFSAVIPLGKAITGCLSKLYVVICDVCRVSPFVNFVSSVNLGLTVMIALYSQFCAEIQMSLPREYTRGIHACVGI